MEERIPIGEAVKRLAKIGIRRTPVALRKAVAEGRISAQRSGKTDFYMLVSWPEVKRYFSSVQRGGRREWSEQDRAMFKSVRAVSYALSQDPSLEDVATFRVGEYIVTMRRAKKEEK